MNEEWQNLTKLTQNKPFIIKKVQLQDQDISIEGSFELPPLAKLSMEDQVFVANFIVHHGSIKKMEDLFGISYPTVKNRLNRISSQLDFVKPTDKVSKPDVLDKLAKGEITVDEAVNLLK